MIIGTSKEPHHPDTGSRFYACAGRLPHQNRSRMDSGDLASAAHHRPHRHCHYHRFPYLEAQTQ